MSKLTPEFEIALADFQCEYMGQPGITGVGAGEDPNNPSSPAIIVTTTSEDAALGLAIPTVFSGYAVVCRTGQSPRPLNS